MFRNKLLTSLSLGVQAVLAMTAHASPALAQTTDNQAVTILPTSELEASFLKVSANCKASHAAFEAVRVGIENIAPEIRAIHAQIEAA
jgi:hypothetical protein